MNTSLWIVQAILGTMMVLLGIMKTFQPIEKLSQFSWTTRSSEGFVRFVGISELLIGAGLILPGLNRYCTHTYPFGCSFSMHDYGVGYSRPRKT